MVQHHSWVFTINNYTETDLERILDCDCQAMKAGHEIGKNGTPHIQGAVHWKSAKTLTAAKALISERAHMEPMKGTWDDQDYCLKDGCVIRSDGTGPQQGKRNDIISMMTDLQNGASDLELMERHPSTYARTMRMVDRYRQLSDRRYRTWMTTCTWYWGPTGVGKSHKAFEGYDPSTHYVHEAADKGWWDDYDGQEIVILNDFRGQLSYHELLTLIDRWPKKVSRRGRAPIPFLAKHIIITSSGPPDQVYPRQNEKFDSIDQLMRRIEIVHVENMPEEL